MIALNTFNTQKILKKKIMLSKCFIFSCFLCCFLCSHAQGRFCKKDNTWKYSFIAREIEIDTFFIKSFNTTMYDLKKNYMDNMRLLAVNDRDLNFWLSFKSISDSSYIIKAELDIYPPVNHCDFFRYKGYTYWVNTKEIPCNLIKNKKRWRRIKFVEKPRIHNQIYFILKYLNTTQELVYITSTTDYFRY